MSESTLTFQDMILKLTEYWAAQGCTVMQPYDGVKLLKAMARYSNFAKGGFEWLPGCYPEQVGLVTVARPALQAVPTAAPGGM